MQSESILFPKKELVPPAPSQTITPEPLKIDSPLFTTKDVEANHTKPIAVGNPFFKLESASPVTVQDIGDNEMLDLVIKDLDPEFRLELADKLIKKDPNHTIGWKAKARALREKGRVDEALISLEKAISLDPSCYAAWMYMGNISLAANNKNKAHLYYKKALEFSDEAIASNKNDVAAWITKARSLSDLEKYAKAVNCFDKAINLFSDESDLWSDKGFALSELQRYEEALASLDKALELNPNNSYAWSIKGFVLGFFGRYEEELECRSMALKLEPEDTEEWANKAYVLSNLERYEEALECYDNLIQMKPRDNEVWNERGDTLFKLERLEEALKSYEQVLSIDPNDASGWSGKGDVLLHLKNYTEALCCLNKSLELDPNQPASWYCKAITEISMGNVDNGLTDLKKAIQMGGKDYKNLAKSDNSFDSIRQTESFQRVLATKKRRISK